MAHLEYRPSTWRGKWRVGRAAVLRLVGFQHRMSRSYGSTACFEYKGGNTLDELVEFVKGWFGGRIELTNLKQEVQNVLQSLGMYCRHSYSDSISFTYSVHVTIIENFIISTAQPSTGQTPSTGLSPGRHKIVQFENTREHKSDLRPGKTTAF